MKNGVCRRRAFNAFIYRIMKKAALTLCRYTAIVTKRTRKQNQ